MRNAVDTDRPVPCAFPECADAACRPTAKCDTGRRTWRDLTCLLPRVRCQSTSSPSPAQLPPSATFAPVPSTPTTSSTLRQHRKTGTMLSFLATAALVLSLSVTGLPTAGIADTANVNAPNRICVIFCEDVYFQGYCQNLCNSPGLCRKRRVPSHQVFTVPLTAFARDPSGSPARRSKRRPAGRRRLGLYLLQVCSERHRKAYRGIS